MRRRKVIGMNDFPSVFRVRQRFDGPVVSDVQSEVCRQLSDAIAGASVRSGQTIALTAGSRGICQIAEILRAAVGYLRRLGAEPFLVPAMGSHGGGTAEGQQEVLRCLGITEQFCGCPIRSSMETVTVCCAREGFPIHFDRIAFEADHVLVCNRVKPHTGFVGDLQSGLMKMLLIGLGKTRGGQDLPPGDPRLRLWADCREVSPSKLLQRCRILGAWQSLKMRTSGPRESKQCIRPTLRHVNGSCCNWLKNGWRALPFDEAELLLVDEIGKNVSGTGMDTNVIGRKHNDHTAIGDERPRIKYIFVRGLTSATHGNAAGVGLAEFALGRVVRSMDVRSTVTNCLTASHPTGAMIPSPL